MFGVFKKFFKDNTGASRLVWMIGILAGIAVAVSLAIYIKNQAAGVAATARTKAQQMINAIR